MPRHKAFTLIELLVVIGIILLLVSIIMPIFSAVADQGHAVLCQSHLRQLWQGFTTFAADHDNRLPGSAADSVAAGPDPDHYDWLGGKYALSGGTTDDLMLPQNGTIFKYVDHNYYVYRCPALEVDDRGTMGGSGAGSNGRFDYVSFEFFSGTHINRLPATAQLTHSDGTVTTLPCPTITEEDAKELNSGNKDPNHSNVDQMGHQHWGGGYYVATDGSVQYFIERPDDYAKNYTATSMRGSIQAIGRTALWGWWETQ